MTDDESVKAKGTAAASEPNSISHEQFNPHAASFGPIVPPTDSSQAQGLAAHWIEDSAKGCNGSATAAAAVEGIDAETDAGSPNISSHSSSPEAVLRGTEQTVEA